MHILLTNDDGIDAPGLKVIERIANSFAKKVTIIAPAQEQSGVGHAITYKRALSYEQRGEDRYAVHGTPADCVMVGLGIILEEKPDLILSGVNAGNNAAQNTLYSGTVGAAIEGAFQGVRSIAMSQFYGAAMHGTDGFEAASEYGEQTLQKILDTDKWEQNGAMLHYNVNFPPYPASQVKGIRFTKQGYRPGIPMFSEMRNGQIWVGATKQMAQMPLDTDIGANVAGYVSITPCGTDLTNHAALAELNDS